jgi:excisionase family DNA binding protein
MSDPKVKSRYLAEDSGSALLFAKQMAKANSTGNAGLDLIADAIAARVAARLNQSQEPRLMSVNDGAVYIGRTPKALRHLIAKGDIPAVREGSRIHLDRTDLDQWIEIRKDAQLKR